MNPSPVVWLNGEFVPETRAAVPALDPLVQLGVGLFETVRVVRGRAPLLPAHQSRLERGLAQLGFDAPPVDWSAVIAELASRRRLPEGVARITVGPGTALVTCSPLPEELEEQRTAGVPLPFARIVHPLPGLKSTSRLPLWLAEQHTGSETAVLGTGGRVLETTRANLFALTERGLETAPKISVLPGIARALVLDLARELGVEVRLRAPRLGEQGQWQHVFLTNAVRGLRPVASFGTRKCGPPEPNGLVRRLQKALDHRMGV